NVSYDQRGVTDVRVRELRSRQRGQGLLRNRVVQSRPGCAADLVVVNCGVLHKSHAAAGEPQIARVRVGACDDSIFEVESIPRHQGHCTGEVRARGEREHESKNCGNKDEMTHDVSSKTSGILLPSAMLPQHLCGCSYMKTELGGVTSTSPGA